jgi:haloalkane dehalogenase
LLGEFTPDPALYPFTSRWFDSSRGRVHYIDEGAGPVIVFFHGNPTWSFLYRNIIAGLRDRFRCIAPDYLGFGLSERPEGFTYRIDEHAAVMGELVDHLELEQYLSMGQDWGGPISMAVGTDRADRVRGVVLGNTWFWPAADLPTKMFSRVMGSPPMQWAITQRNFFVERLIPAGTNTRLDDAEMEHYR